MAEAVVEQRAREIADTTRRYLTALNTGGVAITFGVAGTLAGNGVDPAWAVCPVSIFVLGLAITAGSLFLAKHKALKRRDAAQNNAPAPDFKQWYQRNFTFEVVALLAFLVAVGVASGSSAVSTCRPSRSAPSNKRMQPTSATRRSLVDRHPPMAGGGT